MFCCICSVQSICIAQNAKQPQQTQKEQRRIRIKSTVIDNFTGYGLGDATIQVYDEQGVKQSKGYGLVLTYASRPKMGNDAFAYIPHKSGRYRFRVECKGYKPLDRWHSIKALRRMTSLELPAFELQKDFGTTEDSISEVGLDEVTVTATKIQFYHKGDTLIYNASAFNLPSGSMLEDLIRQLPGATLNEHGEIRVNGRKIELLTLNGKRFFGNNNKLMLENLPYYTVEEIKVFDQSTERSEALGHNVEEKFHTMDVRLKREYSIGYLGNVTAAGGTKERWLGRAFGLRFSDNSRLSFFLNSNNVNETRKPGSDASWKPSDLMAGLQQTHRGGVDVNLWDNYGRYEEMGFVTVAWNKNENESRTAGESFLNGGTAYSRALSDGTQRNLALNLDNTFTLRQPWYVKFHTQGAYSEYRNETTSQSAQFSSDPNRFGSIVQVFDSLLSTSSGEALRRMTVNHTTNELLGKGTNWNIGQQMNTVRALPWGDDFEASASASYRNATTRDWNRYVLEYPHDPALAPDRRNRYNSLPSHGYDYSANALYRFNFLHNLMTEFSYGYRQSYSHSDENRYRLEQIAAWDGELGTLPSTLDWMQAGLDADNSKTIGTMTKNHTLAAKLRKKWTVRKQTLQMDLQLPLDLRLDRLNYTSQPLDTVMKRNDFLFNPNLLLQLNGRMGKWGHRSRLNYSMSTKPVSLLQTVPVQDTYNPLVQNQGNPELKNTIINSLSLGINQDRGMYRLSNILAFTFIGNDIAMGYTYNPNTGVYAYRPANVSGNWSSVFFQMFIAPLDKARKLILDHNLQMRYNKQTDLSSVSTDPYATASIRSRVNNLELSEKLKLTYSIGKARIGAVGQLTFRNTTGARRDFTTLNVFDFNYGLNGQYTLPFGTTLATDIKVYSRRGYGTSAMNSNDVVWNALVSQSFLKDKLNLSLQAFDILHQLKQTTYTVNAQGRTETWQRSLPNYLMLHLTWKFNKNPKKKK